MVNKQTKNKTESEPSEGKIYFQVSEDTDNPDKINVYINPDDPGPPDIMAQILGNASNFYFAAFHKQNKNKIIPATPADMAKIKLPPVNPGLN